MHFNIISISSGLASTPFVFILQFEINHMVASILTPQVLANNHIY